VKEPIFTVIAGANGCGKSTLTQWARAYFQETPVLDPDAVAVKLEATSGEGVSAIEAGKQVLRSADDFFEKSLSFVIETTLSGGTHLKMMRRAKELKYRVRLFYIGTEGVEINIERIKFRVSKGGHDVPEEDQHRRFPRTFANLPQALQLADEALLVDNSTQTGHRAVGLKLQGTGIHWFEPVPEWALFLKKS